MIIAHEWEGEPQSSTSAKKLYRPDEPLIEYEWVGEDHNSESIKKVNGKEAIRNLIPNPSFELEAPSPYNANHLIGHSNERSVSGGYSARAFQGWQNEGFNRLGVRWTVRYPVGYIAIRVWAYIPSSNISTSGRINFQVAGNGPSWSPGATELDEWQHYEYVVENVQEIETSALYIGFETDGNVEGDEIWFDDAMMVVAETEEEALRQLDEGYFDGDSRHEHGVVIARNISPNPIATTEVGWNHNNGRNNTRTSVEIDDHPQGIKTAFKSMYREGGVSTQHLSMYNTGGSGKVDDLPGYKAMGCWIKNNVDSISTWGDIFDANVWYYVVRELSVWPGLSAYPKNPENLPIAEAYVTGHVLCVAETQEEANRMVETYWDGDSRDLLVPNTKVYYYGKWVSLYDYHSY